MSSLAVSVIIPTYKHRDFILLALDSVFAQIFTDYEVIVVNDGSPDDTDSVLQPLRESGEIRYIRQENAGQSAARNRGIAEAKGEFIALLDDDDLWPADKLEWQVAALRNNPEAALVYGDAQYLIQSKESAPYPGEVQWQRGDRFLGPTIEGPQGWVWEQFLGSNPIISPGQTLIRADSLRRIGGFDLSIWGTDDHDLYLRLARDGKFLYRDAVALLYRSHISNASKDVTRMYTNAAKVRRKHIGNLPHPGNLRHWLSNFRYTSSTYAYQFMDALDTAVEKGETRKARTFWLRAVAIRPSLLRRRDTYRRLVQSLVARPSGQSQK